MAIIIKSVTESAMQRAGVVVATMLRILSRKTKVGMTTRQLDEIAMRELKRYEARPSFKGYRGFPAALCVSINDEIVHGIPGDRMIQEGDLVSLDFGAIVDGFHSDAAVTVGIGGISDQARRLLETTKDCLEAAVAVARSGAHLSDISAAIQRCAESKNFSVVREYTGHGIGRVIHEGTPRIPNFGRPGLGPVLQKGMTLAIEPMVNPRGWRTKVKDDGWIVVTADGSLSAHFKKTIAIADSEAGVLTTRKGSASSGCSKQHNTTGDQINTRPEQNR